MKKVIEWVRSAADPEKYGLNVELIWILLTKFMNAKISCSIWRLWL